MYEQIIQFQNLVKRLEEIISFITLIDIQKKITGEYKRIKDKSSIKSDNMCDYMNFIELSNNSKVQYNAVIISVYACFENYIDELAKSYISLYYTNVSKFTELAQKIKNNYFKQAGDYLTNPQRFNGLELSPEKLITNLFENINNNHTIPLQYEFLINHNGNLKIDKIVELFSNLEIDDLRNKIQMNYLMKKYISKKIDIKIEDVSKYLGSSNNNFYELERLVDLRNNVAHGWSEDRISYSLILDATIPFIKCLSNVLLEIALCESFKVLKKLSKVESFDKPIQVFAKNILCLNSKSSLVKKGDYIFYENDGYTQIAKIESLQINKKQIEELVEENIEVGIALDRPIKKSYKFFYLKK